MEKKRSTSLFASGFFSKIAEPKALIISGSVELHPLDINYYYVRAKVYFVNSIPAETGKNFKLEKRAFAVMK